MSNQPTLTWVHAVEQWCNHAPTILNNKNSVKLTVDHAVRANTPDHCPECYFDGCRDMIATYIEVYFERHYPDYTLKWCDDLKVEDRPGGGFLIFKHNKNLDLTVNDIAVAMAESIVLDDPEANVEREKRWAMLERERKAR